MSARARSIDQCGSDSLKNHSRRLLVPDRHCWRGRVHHLGFVVAQTLVMAEPVRVRDLTSVEGNKLLGIVTRGSGSVVRLRRAQIVLWSAEAMDVPAIARIAFTSGDRVREEIHNFNTDGFAALASKYAGGAGHRS